MQQYFYRAVCLHILQKKKKIRLVVCLIIITHNRGTSYCYSTGMSQQVRYEKLLNIFAEL